ncbi:MAG: ribonuclease [Paucibacter sp.]|nr:ribonuclease [Roseateles sp.]
MLSRPRPWSAWRKSVLAAFLLATVAINVQVQAKETLASLEIVALSALPREAQKTHQLILAGGPFPYDKDGIVFGNRERILPKKPRGYYHEYTVTTPGARNRGARRLVCGGKPPSTPDVCYYTGDHYSSFKRVVQ